MNITEHCMNITEPPKPIRIHAGFLIKCNQCRDPTKSFLDIVNDGVINRKCSVCKEDFVSEPVWEVITPAKTAFKTT